MNADHENMSDEIEKPQAKSQVRQRLEADIDAKWADMILFGCFFCSGLVDSMAYNMYSSFVSMQTGNTIFVGLGVNGQPESASKFRWAKSLAAIVCFSLGAFFFSTFHRVFGPQKRWVLISSFAMQALMIAVVAIITSIPVVPNEPPVSDNHMFPASDFAAITILSFQSAGQIVASRALKYNAMPTVVLTSLYCDLMSDAQLFTAPLGKNANRERRFIGAVLLLVGAIAGAYLTTSDAGFKGGLWIAVGIKVVMTVAWFFWKRKASTKE